MQLQNRYAGILKIENSDILRFANSNILKNFRIVCRNKEQKVSVKIQPSALYYLNYY